ncbi:hypothetical protein BCR39DRAFT_554407 [Naematelia encephala]|uniref:Rad51-like C-terminal domain-containing protein n=1 Tax=Naematelia encephala TaxID=71784 RepID=A0A1Y2AFA9_9TREE|nr:hypothetical protein BCR39DRAFT_554407 [Naematelia encephala]
MLLKRISDRLPTHLSKLIPQLESAGIKTTDNILFTSVPVLLKLVPAIDEDDLQELSSRCLDITGPETVTGDQELERALRVGGENGWVGWGKNGLDGLIVGPDEDVFGQEGAGTGKDKVQGRDRAGQGGWDRAGQDEVQGWDGVGVIEIAGPKRVGKSLLLLHAVLRKLVYDPIAICRWLDTEGSFSPTRASAILDSWAVDDARSVLERLVVVPCFRIEPDLYDVLGQVRNELEQIQEGVARTRLLVVDPVTNLFKDLMTNTSAQGHAIIVTVLEEITSLTYEFGLTTFLTNAVTSSVPTNPLSVFSATTIKPALGMTFTYYCDISLLVQETGKIFGTVDEQERERVRTQPGLRGVVEVLKSRISPGGRWTVFETDGTRLYDVVPPPLDDERTVLASAGLASGPPRPLIGPLAVTMIP